MTRPAPKPDLDAEIDAALERACALLDAVNRREHAETDPGRELTTWGHVSLSCRWMPAGLVEGRG